MSKRTTDELRLLQNLPLEIKVAKTKLRIREWVDMYGVEGVYVSFSGGKDSTVLLHIVREMYPNVEAVFVNTGLEYPEIQQFVKTFDNVTILRPKMRFDEAQEAEERALKAEKCARAAEDVAELNAQEAERAKAEAADLKAQLDAIAGAGRWKRKKLVKKLRKEHKAKLKEEKKCSKE